MYPIHTTPGFIIDSHPSGEAGKLLFIFTRDLGLILASAQGIRFEKSKLRYHTQNYSFGLFSFVRGKEIWRLTNGQENQEGILSLELSVKSQELLIRLAFLMKRLLHGEEAHPELFDHLSTVRRFLVTQLTEEQFKTLESLTVIRIMHALGYIGDDQTLKDCFTSTDVTIQLLDQLLEKRIIINQHINKALKESHL